MGVLTQELRERLEKLSTTNVSDALDALGLKGSTYGVNKMYDGCRKIIGEAVTMKVVAAGLCQFRAVYGHSTFCGTFQQVDASYQCGFSGTRKPDDTKNLTLFNIQTYLPYGVDFSAAGAEGFAYLLQLYHVYFLLSAIKKASVLLHIHAH